MLDSTTNTKTCTKCGRTLPATAEYFRAQKRGKYGLESQCRECRREYTRKWQAANPEKVRESNRKWQAANPEKVRESIRKWQAANPEKAREYNRKNQQKWVAANPEKVREYNRKWYTANPEKAREYNRKRHAANPERIREYNRKYRAENLEKERDRSRKWSAENPERARANNQNRRARERGAPGSHTAAEIAAQYKRQKKRCYYCGCSIKDHTNRHVEHIVPLSRGGSNDISNIVLACANCNLRKSDKMPHEWGDGGRLL